VVVVDVELKVWKVAEVDGNIKGKAEGKKGERTAGSHWKGFNYVGPPRPFVGFN